MWCSKKSVQYLKDTDKTVSISKAKGRGVFSILEVHAHHEGPIERQRVKWQHGHCRTVLNDAHGGQSISWVLHSNPQISVKLKQEYRALI